MTDGFELKRIGSSALSASNPEGRARSAAACRCPQVVRRPAVDVQKETVAFGCASQMPRDNGKDGGVDEKNYCSLDLYAASQCYRPQRMLAMGCKW